MKRYLLIVFFFNLITHSFSQSLTLSDGLTPVSNNADISLNGGVDPIDCFITVNNVTGTNKTVLCKKAIIQNVTGSMNYFCWGACYPPNVYVGAIPVSINANQSNNVDFSGHYECLGNTGTAIIRYTFWVSGNTNDSVCFNVHFTGCTVGLNELDAISGLTDVYPNPAKDIVSIRYSLKNGKYAIVDLVSMQGSLISRNIIDGMSGAISLSLNGLSRGVYFILLRENGVILSKKKLVVE